MKIKIKNILLHFHTINKHRFLVFKLCVKAGIPFRGLVHDLSKYSFAEFMEGAKYYQGDRSPIVAAKKDLGYSKAWLHHKGRNKHHAEYWYDPRAINSKPMLPYKYTVEMLCDTVAAGIVYNKSDWTTSTQLKYWKRESQQKNITNENLKLLLTEAYTKLSNENINGLFNKKYLRELYEKYSKIEEKRLEEMLNKKQIKSETNILENSVLKAQEKNEAVKLS